MVRRARENAVRASARYLEGLDVTPIARGKVDRTAAKRNRGRSNTDSSCSAIHVCTITARLETLRCRKQLETLGCSKPGVLACRHYMRCMPSHGFPLLEAACRSVVSVRSRTATYSRPHYIGTLCCYPLLATCAHDTSRETDCS